VEDIIYIKCYNIVVLMIRIRTGSLRRKPPKPKPHYFVNIEYYTYGIGGLRHKRQISKDWCVPRFSRYFHENGLLKRESNFPLLIESDIM